MTLLRYALLLMLGCSAGASTQAAPAAPTVKRPNIVILLADDWGFTDVGAFGSEIHTPNIDALAQQGVRFANFHATASCSPSRSMLLTGVDNHLNGVGNMHETIPLEHAGKPGYLSVLNQRVVTVSSLLQDSGYRTYIAGKWHVGKEAHNLPDQRGFDHSLIQGDSGSDNWETDKRYLALTDKVYWFEDGREAVMPAEFYSSQFYVDKMLHYLQTDAKSVQPFFAYIGFQANHIPVQAPKEFIQKYHGRYDRGWTVLRQERRDRAASMGLIAPDTPMITMKTTLDWDKLSATDQGYQARRMEVYAAMADAMDYHVGRLVSYLKQSGQYDNTVFIFMSDNGAEASDPFTNLSAKLWIDWYYNTDLDQLGAKGAYSIIGPSWSSAAAAPLSTYKFYAGEGGIRVPLVISGIQGMQKNTIEHSFTHINDLVPTMLELAGVTHPGRSYKGHEVEPITGKSLLPVMLGSDTRVHAPTEAIGYELSGNQALFKGDLKLLKNIPPVGDGLWHLYNIQTDPGETRDLQQQLPLEFRQMQQDYQDYAKRNGVLPMPKGYEPIRQVMINSIIHVFLPRYLPAVLFIFAALAVWLLRRRYQAARQGN